MIKSKKVVVSSMLLLALILSACSVTQGIQTTPTQNAAAAPEQTSSTSAQVLEYTQGEDALVNIYKNVTRGWSPFLSILPMAGWGRVLVLYMIWMATF